MCWTSYEPTVCMNRLSLRNKHLWSSRLHESCQSLWRNLWNVALIINQGNIKRSQHVTGWSWKHSDFWLICPQISQGHWLQPAIQGTWTFLGSCDDLWSACKFIRRASYNHTCVSHSLAHICICYGCGEREYLYILYKSETDSLLQMNWLSLRNNRLKFKTARKLLIILEEFIEYTPL